MKNHIIYIIALFVLFSCSNSSEKVQLHELCENEIGLISNSKNNWRIPVDSIINCDDYYSKNKAERKKEYAQVDYSSIPDGFSGYSMAFLDTSISTDSAKQIIKKFNPHPNVYPYIEIKGVNISLMQLLKISGGGYQMFGNDNIFLSFNGKYHYQNDDTTHEKVFDFYCAYDTTNADKVYYWNKISGPVILIYMNGLKFNELEVIIEDISLAYIKAMNVLSEDIFHKKVCDLSIKEINKMKHLYPFKIKIFNCSEPPVPNTTYKQKR